MNCEDVVCKELPIGKEQLSDPGWLEQNHAVVNGWVYLHRHRAYSSGKEAFRNLHERTAQNQFGKKGEIGVGKRSVRSGLPYGGRTDQAESSVAHAKVPKQQSQPLVGGLGLNIQHVLIVVHNGAGFLDQASLWIAENHVRLRAQNLHTTLNQFWRTDFIRGSPFEVFAARQAESKIEIPVNPDVGGVAVVADSGILFCVGKTDFLCAIGGTVVANN